MLEKIQNMLSDGSWLDLVQPLLINMVLAVVIYVVGSWIAKKLVTLIDTLMTKRGFDESLTRFLHAVIGTLLKFIVCLIAIEQLGIDTTSLLALLGAAGLAVGLALKDSLSNFASGVMLILMKPFKIGDFIEAAGVAAVVEKITVFSTVLKTGDNREIIVPNSQIYGGTITNYSARTTRRVDLTIGIGYDDDIKKARNIMLDIINNDERILKDPEPVIAVGELADSSVNFVVRSWVKSEDYWAVYWYLLETIKTSFDENGVSIPYPQQDVHVHQAAS